jgi:fatty-acid desaturase
VIRRTLAPACERGGERVQELKKNWVNILFLSLTPVIGIFGTLAYAIAYGVAWWEPTLFFVLFGLVSFSVTAGYHRCFAHKAYVCHQAIQAFYLFFGAMAFQNAALKWSSDHRDHHRYAAPSPRPLAMSVAGAICLFGQLQWRLELA